MQNTITAIESKIQSVQAVKQTVALLEQVAQLYAIYDNAMSTYESIGNAVDSARNMGSMLGKVKESWTSGFDMDWSDPRAVNRQLGRWGIRPSKTGPLADINRSFESTDRDTRKFNRDLASAPRALSRDRFIANTVKGARTKETAETARTGRKELDLSATQAASAMTTAADYSSGQLTSQLVFQADVRDAEREGLKTMEEQLASNEMSQMDLQQATNANLITSNKIMLDMADQQAAVAAEQSVANGAIRTQLDYLVQREEAQASVTQVMKRMDR
jgi:hypothetical protein